MSGNSDEGSSSWTSSVWKKHWQKAVSLFLVLLFGHFIIREGIKAFTGGVHFVDVSFALHNVIFLGAILIRRDHIAINKRIRDQAIALIAFFSGILFIDPQALQSLSLQGSLLDTRFMPSLLTAADWVIAISWILGALVTINLGRSFGILIACRQIKTHGAYRLIRHPMYVTDILFRMGIILKYPYAYNIVIVLLSTAAYGYRAILEERLLMKQPGYPEYMERVRYRMLPGIF